MSLGSGVNYLWEAFIRFSAYIHGVDLELGMKRSSSGVNNLGQI